MGAKLDIKDNYNYAPLDYVMTPNRKEVAKLLIEKGAQVTDHMLNSAAFNGNNEVVEMLLNKGLNVNALCDRCPSPFHSAMYKDHDDVVELMIKHGASC